MDEPTIRLEQAGDEAAISQVVTEAFRAGAEAALVEELRRSGGLWLSLVAEADGVILGHVALSPVTVAGVSGGMRWQGLGPLAVAPTWQRRGIGMALVRSAVAIAGERGATAVFVLGASRYYGRLGFDVAAPLGWRCSYEAPAPAFRVCRMDERGRLPPPGTVHYHPAFDAL